MKFRNVTIQMIAAEQYFPVIVFVFDKVVKTLESLHEILKYDHSNKSC